MTNNNEGSDNEPCMAWVYLAACSYVLYLYGGIFKCVGLVYVQLFELFDEEEVVTSFLITANLMMFMLGNLVISYIAYIYISYIGYGALQGFAMGASFAPLLSTVTLMFNKNRTFANGCLYAASSLGAATLPFIYDVTIKEFTFRGAVLLLAGVWLNEALVGAILNPSTVSQLKLTASVQKSGQASSTGQHGPEITIVDEEDKLKTMKEPRDMKQTTSYVNEGFDSPKLKIGNKNLFNKEKKPTKTSEPKQINEELNIADIQQQVAVGQIRLDQGNRSVDPLEVIDRKENITNKNSKVEKKVVVKVRSKNYDPVKNPTTPRAEHFCQPVCYLLKTKVFWIVVFYNLLLNSSYVTAFVYIPAFAEEVGFSLTESAGVMSMIGGIELVVRAGYGFLGDRPWVNRRIVIFITSLMCGISIFILSVVQISKQAPILYGIALSVSLLGGVYGTYIGPVCAEFIKPEYLHIGVGIVLSLNGFALSGGQLLFGYFQKLTGTYLTTLQVAAGCYILGGLLSGLSVINVTRKNPNL